MNNDLISRETLKKKLQARHDNGEEDFDKGYNIGLETAIDLIDNVPSINPCDNCDLYFKATTKEIDRWYKKEEQKGGAEK